MSNYREMAKILIAVGIASLCAAISTAYDFKDSAFSEYF